MFFAHKFVVSGAVQLAVNRAAKMGQGASSQTHGAVPADRPSKPVRHQGRRNAAKVFPLRTATMWTALTKNCGRRTNPHVNACTSMTMMMMVRLTRAGARTCEAGDVYGAASSIVDCFSSDCRLFCSSLVFDINELVSQRGILPERSHTCVKFHHGERKAQEKPSRWPERM